MRAMGRGLQRRGELSQRMDWRRPGSATSVTLALTSQIRPQTRHSHAASIPVIQEQLLLVREKCRTTAANDFVVHLCQGESGKIPVGSTKPSAKSTPRDHKSSNSTPAFGKGGLQETWDYYQDLVGPKNLDTLSLDDRRVSADKRPASAI